MPITIQLKGGLGNQLFQLAVGLHLSEIDERPVCYSSAFLSGHPLQRVTPREFAIRVLLNQEEVSQLSRTSGALLQAGHRFSSLLSVDESRFQFGQQLPKFTRLVSGYFQDYRFASTVKHSLLNRLMRSTDFSTRIACGRVERVGIHLRFGDYRLNQQTRAFHGLTTMDYFATQAESLCREHNLNEILVVSDDLDHAREELSKSILTRSREVLFIEPGSEYEHLAELARCASIVASNSSFSWWGAWIGESLWNSSIVAPDPWYANAAVDTRFLLPPTWRTAPRLFD
jgi:hypothetical protein